MAAIEEIAESVIRENIIRAVGDVFKTMLNQSVQFRSVDQASIPQPGSALQHVVGTVGFIGDINGLIYLYIDEDFAGKCTREMLGMTDQEFAENGSESVNDAIGEITNMVVGSFKNGLCDAGYPCKLTIPSILRGRNFSVEQVSSTQRHVYCFETQGRQITADILLKTED
ncbi:MAG TPA: chemotaxis protein CheX [Opitutaceae bacterium]|jgi:chemotaxis protein CheX|nr:chemotaxis protein CheX [Opitutaceae bacterium]